ncbi:MAG: hypothetical protein UU95_C0029G0013 [Parcubacteria group bacterium GW2011_GWC2_42_12]|uniref:Tim44-like domain-containing protein n=1 Tax=Candidatus Falkowbacteria bacterium RIFCSPHIGHO2_02_FULL_42_9 TaxID=1797986 RepID=A0A1F5S8U0_9BACT|nr:MAG: hypothetical protein UU95_C0029G0013 [Parcubacteria group bacterium GW2011_GWC2_42_12]OGF23077.1 MAG: hypothetical protein A3D45_01745 [Candidatus Falkowbacteria bacterium RIFCSPHIGHO2_02_FULL_42_9]
MNKRIWGIIIIIVGLLLMVAIIYFMFFYKSAAPEPVIEQPVTSVSQTTVTPEPTSQPVTVQPVSPLKKAEVKADDLVRLAAAFAERFGSFSNQSDYGNLRDLRIFMTDNLKTWAENYINNARLKKGDASIYYGIVTKAVLSEVKQFDSDLGQAEILVKTQRRESAGVTGNSTTFYQDIIIKYRLEGSVWRVDGAYWQNK